MRSFSFLMILAFAGCGNLREAKSIYDLQETDFNRHDLFIFASGTFGPPLDIDMAGSPHDGGVAVDMAGGPQDGAVAFDGGGTPDGAVAADAGPGGTSDGGVTLDGFGWQKTMVPLLKGQVVRIDAVGTISYTVDYAPGTMTTGPNGDDGLGGTPYLLVNRPAFGLFARINESVIAVGGGNVFLAPDSGVLELGINACRGCAIVDGGFHVTVSSALNDAINVATEPKLGDNTIVDSKDVTVAAGKGWIKSGLHLSKGEKAFIDATGSVTASFFGPPTSYDANGDPGNWGGTGYLIENHFAYRLHGRMGSQIIELGTSGVFLAPIDGELELGINDRGNDATGALQVRIGKGVRPAVGLDSALAGTLVGAAMQHLVPDGQWRSTSLSVTRGQPIAFVATGQVVTASLFGHQPVDPYGDSSIGGTPFVLPNRFLDGLYGRIGTQVFFVGGSNVVLAPDSGALELVINAVPPENCNSGTLQPICDSTGGFDVTFATSSGITVVP